MSWKLAVIVVYALGFIVPSALLVPAASMTTGSMTAGAGEPFQQAAARQTAARQTAAKPFKLDVKGRRGMVLFDHKAHEARLNPDPQAPHQSKAGAACAGCHHTQDSFGIPQLLKCSTCHRAEGSKVNPKNRDFDEVFAERAFHDSCIACHRASAKGPTTCNSCHQPVATAQ